MRYLQRERNEVAEVVCEAWEYIWKWSKENKRAFTTDFELYDEKQQIQPTYNWIFILH